MFIMDVVTTSLEALIQRATNPQNKKPDIAATEAFCVMLAKESEGVHIASKLLATQIQSTNEWEALQALALLDTCMRRCGPSFHAEVGKFRFLNEMIKLVSPKYLGDKTPSLVRQKVLELLQTWTTEYPKEIKIKEAYEMLKKQGVIKEDPVQSPNTNNNVNKSSSSKNTIFEDEEKSRLLQKLLQSKNPDDLHAANRLIRTMVKEDEKRVQQNSRRIMELESVHNNVRLLSDMLDSYSSGQTSVEDFELIKELYDACERLKPIILRLANETQDNEEMLAEVLAASDALGQVFEKYASVVILGRSIDTSKNSVNNGPSLLDFSNPTDGISSDISLVSNKNNDTSAKTAATKSTATDEATVLNSKSDMEVLRDIFTSIESPNTTALVPDIPLLLPEVDVMQPTVLSTKKKAEEVNTSVEVDSKAKALDDLNELGESLLKETLSSVSLNGHFGKLSSKAASRVPMKSITKTADVHTPIEKYNTSSTNSNVSKLITSSNDSKANSKIMINDKCNAEVSQKFVCVQDSMINDQSNCTISKLVNVDHPKNTEENDDSLISINNESEIKSLADINVTLENIKPGPIPPLTVIEEKNGITVVLHFAKDSPRPDVSVIVATTMSKNSKSLSNYLFQAVVPKRCKCRLQPPSGTELPAHNPFLPPSAITQIMLIANPYKEPLSLKFMLSYTMDDETFTEMGEVDKLPSI